jgi:hypothetical protein
VPDCRGADYAGIAPAGAIQDATSSAFKAFLNVRQPAGESLLLKALDALQGER